MATVVRVKSDTTQTNEAIVQLNTSTNKFDALPIDLGADTGQLYLITYGTGFANGSSLENVTATIGGVTAPVIFAGAHETFTAADQANIQIPRSLAGRGDVDVILTMDGKRANTVTIYVKSAFRHSRNSLLASRRAFAGMRGNPWKAAIAQPID